jgi:hypothetical protein
VTLEAGSGGEGALPLRDSLRRGIARGLQTAVFLVKIVFPLTILVSVLRDSGVLARMAGVFAPLMKYLDLPGEAALAIIAGNLGNIYAGLAVLAPLGLDPRQMTIVGLMLGISHSLILEAAVFQRMGARPVGMSIFRFAASVGAGLILVWVMP